MKRDLDSNYNFLLVGEATHTGQVRKANEDEMVVFETASMKVFAVCDGMGGHVGGKAASQTATAAIRDFMTNNIILDPREAIYNAIIAANEAILNRSRQQPELAGMGSTCVILAVTSDGKVYYGHVGDSRIYIIANHLIKPLTEDHSVVFEMFKAGMIKTREEMERHARKNEITNALGLPNMKPPTICDVPIEPDSGNCFLLCSDGLTGMVDDEQIQRVVSKHNIPIQQRADKLVQMANANGGVDNITVYLVEFAVGTQQINDRKDRQTKRWQKMLLYVLPIVLILAGGGAAALWFLKGEKNTEIVSENGKEVITIVSKESIDCQEGLLIEYQLPKYRNKTIQMESVEVLGENDMIECSIPSYDPACIIFKWTKEFSGNEIIVSCETEFEIYHITIPVKQKQNPAVGILSKEREKAVEKPNEKITLNDTVSFSKKGEYREIGLNKAAELKTVRWKTGEMLTAPSNVKANMTTSQGRLVIEWAKDDLPSEVIISCITTGNQPHYITIPLKEVKEEQDYESHDLF